ncbi:hypothetical protein H0H93_000089 [Arthromyces matolae]|nr:hypothetical protein H0H93_000089 [Arthromyces matolae]
MFNLFRHVARPTWSSIRGLKNLSSPSAPNFVDATKLLEAQAQNRPLSANSSGSPTLSIFGTRLTKLISPVTELSLAKDIKWKNFRHKRVIKPHEFSYNARLITKPTYVTRRAKVGPPTSIARRNDPFHQLDIDPVDLVLQPDMFTPYLSEMGKIYSRNVTGLTMKSQRRLGKAIRRAKMMGVIPVLSRYQSPDIASRSWHRRK